MDTESACVNGNSTTVQQHASLGFSLCKKQHCEKTSTVKSIHFKLQVKIQVIKKENWGWQYRKTEEEEGKTMLRKAIKDKGATHDARIISA